jgi:hypothetical protein
MPSNADAKLRVASKACCVSAQCFVRSTVYFRGFGRTRRLPRNQTGMDTRRASRITHAAWVMPRNHRRR